MNKATSGLMRGPLIPRWLIITAICVVAATPVSAQRAADFVASDARAAGRGGVDVAIAEDLSALRSNPAGLVKQTTPWRIDFAVRGFDIRSEYEDSFNPGGVSSSEQALAPYLSLGWNPDPERDGRPGDLGFALGIQHVAGFQSDLRINTQDFPDPLSTSRKVDYVYTGVHLGGGVRLSDELSVGASFSLTYSDLEVTEPFELSIFQFRGASPLGTPWGELLNQMFGITAVRIEGVLDSSPTLGFGLTLGVQYQPSDEWTLGLAWRSPGWQKDYDADVEVDISRIFGEPDPITFPNGFAVNYDGTVSNFDYPQAISVGAAWHPSDSNWRLALELRWTHWSATHDRVDIQLRNGDNAGFNAFVGADRLDIALDYGWRDQYSAQIGVEYAISERLIARAGFGVWTSPVPSDGPNPNAPSYGTFMATLGLGYATPSWSVDLAWLHLFQRSRSVDDSRISSDLDQSRQSIALDSLFLSFTLKF